MLLFNTTNISIALKKPTLSNPQAIVHSLGLSDKDYKFGVTRVFFRPGKYSEFDTMMKSDPENLKSIVDAVLSWLVKSRWRKSIFAVLSIIKCKFLVIYYVTLLFVYVGI